MPLREKGGKEYQTRGLEGYQALPGGDRLVKRKTASSSNLIALRKCFNLGELLTAANTFPSVSMISSLPFSYFQIFHVLPFILSKYLLKEREDSCIDGWSRQETKF